jgi:hypothetical protein
VVDPYSKAEAAIVEMDLYSTGIAMAATASNELQFRHSGELLWFLLSGNATRIFTSYYREEMTAQ